MNIYLPSFYLPSFSIRSRLRKKGNASMSANKKTNRLINENSPKLLQHAYNPVGRFPWREKLLTKPKQKISLFSSQSAAAPATGGKQVTALKIAFQVTTAYVNKIHSI